MASLDTAALASGLADIASRHPAAAHEIAELMRRVGLEPQPEGSPAPRAGPTTTTTVVFGRAEPGEIPFADVMGVEPAGCRSVLYYAPSGRPADAALHDLLSHALAPSAALAVADAVVGGAARLGPNEAAVLRFTPAAYLSSLDVASGTRYGGMERIAAHDFIDIWKRAGLDVRALLRLDFDARCAAALGFDGARLLAEMARARSALTREDAAAFDARGLDLLGSLTKLEASNPELVEVLSSGAGVSRAPASRIARAVFADIAAPRRDGAAAGAGASRGDRDAILDLFAL